MIDLDNLRARLRAVIKDAEPLAVDIVNLLEQAVAARGAVRADGFTSIVAVLEASIAWVIASSPAGTEGLCLNAAASHIQERRQHMEKSGYLAGVARYKAKALGFLAGGL